MDMSKKTEVEEKKEEPKTEKKGFWSKLKGSVNNTMRDSRLESEYNDNHKEFELFTGCGLGDQKTVHGDLNNTKKELTIYGTVDVPYSSIIATVPANKDKELPKFYYVVKFHHDEKDVAKVTIKEDGKDMTYERPLTVLSLEEGVKEVKVIKAHGNYYLMKDEKK